MDFTHRHTLYHNHCKQLIGSQLVKAKYAELLHQSAEPNYKTHFADIDTVAYSVFLYSRNNDVVEFWWDSHFVQYEVGVKINESGPSSVYQMWDVSKECVWKSVISETITDVRIGWQEINTYEPGSGILGLKRAPKAVSPLIVPSNFLTEKPFTLALPSF